MITKGNFYSKAGTNTLIAVLSTGTSIVLATAITPAIVLSLGTENWARYAFFLLYVAALQCVEAALQAYSLQVRAIANSTGTSYAWWHDRTLLGSMRWLTLIAAVVIAFNYVFPIVVDGEMRALLSLAVLNVLPRAHCAVLKGNMLGQQSQKHYYFVTTIFNVGRPLFLLLCLWGWQIRSVVVLAVLYVLFSFFELCVLWALLGKKDAKLNVDSSQASSERFLLSALIAANLMSTLSTNLDKILAYGALNLRVLGEYTFAAQIAALLYLFVNAAVSAFTPKFRELYIRRDYGEIRRFFMLLATVNNFLVLTAAVVFMTNGSLFLSIFKGHIDTHALLTTFAILAGATFVSCNLWFPGAIATSIGKPHFSVFTNIGFIAAYLCAFLFLRGHFQGLVFAVSMFCAAVLTTASGLVYFKLRVLDFSLLRYCMVAVVLPVVIVATTYGLPALLIRTQSASVLPGIAFAVLWLCALSLAAFRGRHLLVIAKQNVV